MKRGKKLTEFFVIYNMQDEIITTLESYEELAKYLNKTVASARSSVSRIRTGEIKTVINKDGNIYKLYIYKKGEE